MPDGKPPKINFDAPGKAVPNAPFTGEMMTCVSCHKQKKSNPRVSSNWTLIEIDDKRFYVCPKCFGNGKHLRVINNLTSKP